MLLLVKPNRERHQCSRCSWQPLKGSVPISMDWEGTKAALEAGVEERSCKAAGAGKGAMGEARAGGTRGSGQVRSPADPAAQWGCLAPGRVPAKDPSGTRGGDCPCCPSLWMSWHCQELVPLCPQGWGVHLGAHGLCPSAAPRCFPAGFWGFGGAEGILPGAGREPQ